MSGPIQKAVIIVPMPIFLTFEMSPANIADTPPLTIKPISTTVTSVATLIHLY